MTNKIWMITFCSFGSLCTSRVLRSVRVRVRLAAVRRWVDDDRRSPCMMRWVTYAILITFKITYDALDEVDLARCHRFPEEVNSVVPLWCQHWVRKCQWLGSHQSVPFVVCTWGLAVLSPPKPSESWCPATALASTQILQLEIYLSFRLPDSHSLLALTSRK